MELERPATTAGRMRLSLLFPVRQAPSTLTTDDIPPRLRANKLRRGPQVFGLPGGRRQIHLPNL